MGKIRLTLGSLGSTGTIFPTLHSLDLLCSFPSPFLDFSFSFPDKRKKKQPKKVENHLKFPKKKKKKITLTYKENDTLL